MSRRLLDVTAYTTLDYAEAVVTGRDFEERTVAVVDATADRDDPDCVRLRLEVDNLAEEHVPAHVDEVRLPPADARALAADLEKHADRVEAAVECGSDGDGDGGDSTDGGDGGDSTDGGDGTGDR